MHASVARLLAHDRWANRVVLDALDAAPAALEPARRLMRHVAATHALWLDRIHARPARHPVWPDAGAVDPRAVLDEAAEDWAAVLAGRAPGEAVSYVNSKGEPWTSAVVDLAVHVALHGVHHRAQVLALLRAEGLEPPYVDFVQAARTGAV